MTLIQNDHIPHALTPTEIRECRMKAALYIFFSVIILIFGSLFVGPPGFTGKVWPTFAAICLTAWGMGWYAISKGYSRSIGIALGILWWIGLIILWLMKDKYKSQST
jgi:hypothetical protein